MYVGRIWRSNRQNVVVQQYCGLLSRAPGKHTFIVIGFAYTGHALLIMNDRSLDPLPHNAQVNDDYKNYNGWLVA